MHISGGALLYGIDQVSCTDNNSSGNVWFDITPTGTFPSSVKKAGTYNIKCTYVPRIKSYPGQSYYMKEIYDRDSVTITKMVGNYYAEGYFNAVCIDFYNNIDTVFVKGSFKGFLNQ